MRVAQIRAMIVAFFLTLGPAIPLFPQDRLEISEFLAINDRGLDDEDRDEEDWIEIHNAGSGRASLEGWYLTDRADNLTMWRFPAVTLEADGYLVVFASGKDRRGPAGTLHTNFRLSGAGEYLALVHPDGVTIASAFAPTFPVQAPDVSYGLSGATTETVLLATGVPARAFVPPNGSLEQKLLPDNPRPWTTEDFDDSYWPAGKTGVGFGYVGQIGLDVSAMRGVNETVYVRIPFVVEDPSVIRSMTLRMRFNDGMIAYINGREVARDNAPELETETWNSGATASWPNSRTVPPKDFPIRRFDFLHVGTNVLAIQGLNFGLTSADLLVHPELIAAVAGTEPIYRYFPAPTPGRPNDAGVEILGPIIRDPDYHPKTVTLRDGIQITARIAPSFAPVASARLHYRVMFNAEVTAFLLDDGKSGDDEAGDGVYGARIPSGGFTPGQMVRWYLTATDSAGRMSRYPAYLDPLNSPQYCGTVVADPSLTNPLPVLHWFIENPNAANSDTGTRCAIAYGGEFYDNVWINLHGQSSRGFPKKSYDIDFNRGHNFRWAPGQPRVGDINLLTTFPDKAQMRNILAYETYRDSGCAYHWVLAIRVQQNAAFWGTAHLMENGDKDWLIRLGANTEGALYKMYNTFTEAGHATTGAEKKTRKHEDNADLLALFQGLSLSGDALRRYLYDNVDVAQVVNFLATRALTGDTDCCHKNYYFYRDTGRSNEWQMWPWDVDLSFGRRWNSAQTYWNHVLDVATPLFTGNNNRLPQSIFNTPELRQMYLRRVRTLMDELLKPGPTVVVQPTPTPTPGPTPRPRNAAAVLPLYTVAAEMQYYEPRIDELAAQIAADAALDNAKWNSHAWGNGSTAPSYPQPFPDAVAELRDSYLPERRRQLFDRLTSGASELPNAQPAGTVLLFGATDTKPLSGNLDEQYIQLLNPNAFAVDISGWTLTVGTDAPKQIFRFRGGAVIPANGTLYVAANRVAFRARRLAPTGGQALFVTGDFTGPLATAGETLELTDRQGAKVAATITRSSSR